MPSVWNLLSAWLAALASVLVLVGNAPSEAPIRALPVASSDATANDFLEEFTGAPSEPQPFASDSWAVNVASRDPSTWVNLNPMTAQHGSGCEGPTHTHTVTAYDDAVFLCNDHVMTAMNAEGYGVIYLTPNALVDFSEGTASVSFDVSTFRNSGRDFIGLWVTAYDDNLALPYNPGEGDVDLQGAPHNAVHFELDRGCSGFRASAFVNGREMLGHTGCWELPTWYEVLTPDSARRDTIELLISRDHVKLWMPDYGLVLAKADVALDFTQGVIQLGHHSYTPKKDCGIANSAMDASACGPTTWHWDNVIIQAEKVFAAPGSSGVPVSTDTPTPMPTSSATAFPTASATAAQEHGTPTATASATATTAPPSSVTPSPEGSATATPGISTSPTASPTATTAPSPSATPSPTETVGPWNPPATATPTPTMTPEPQALCEVFGRVNGIPGWRLVDCETFVP